MKLNSYFHSNLILAGIFFNLTKENASYLEKLLEVAWHKSSLSTKSHFKNQLKFWHRHLSIKKIRQNESSVAGHFIRERQQH